MDKLLNCENECSKRDFFSLSLHIKKSELDYLNFKSYDMLANGIHHITTDVMLN